MSLKLKKKKLVIPAIIAITIGVMVIALMSVFLIPTQTTLTNIPETAQDIKRNEALGLAQKFIVTTPTFEFDGDINTLDTISIDLMESVPTSYLIKFEFDSANKGFGNREGQDLDEVVTHHQMEIIVSEGSIVSAITDRTWDELNHQFVLKQQKLQSSNEPVSTFDGKVTNLSSLVLALKSRGLSVNLIEELDDSAYSVPTNVYSVGGEEIQVYEFTSEYETAKARKLISPDGTEIGSSVIRWIDTPHFYSQGKIIVQYVGHNPEILNLLDSYLGSQFAGM